ncbi:hypothetical protein CATYP_05440 [Corynebacterium atypicum]|uniref:Thioesterase domain-containing protein n=1 Tax=Corynebacterium atypicum TaxID=191610 RepID=A0ABN4DFJ7_9CORY|nr:PaaI family thioesterase [Corynebacterium atypicum]AIG64154.1 hypothetical protein CATYP_05440 [Corynebacterium atypicum]
MRLLELYHKAQQRDLNDEELAQVNEDLYGLERTLGIRYVALGPKHVEAELEVGSGHLQPAGLVHGGVYTALVESVGSTAALLATGKLVVGMTNSTDFIASTRSGLLRASATPLQVGKRTQLWQARITDDAAHLLAHGQLRTMTQYG